MTKKHLFNKKCALGIVTLLTLAGLLLPAQQLEEQRRRSGSGTSRRQATQQRGSRTQQRSYHGGQRRYSGSYQRGRYNRCYGGNCRRRNYYYSGYGPGWGGPGWYGGYYDWGVPLALTGGVVLGAAAASAGQDSGSTTQSPTVMPIWQSDGSLLWAQCSPAGACYLMPDWSGQPLTHNRVIP